MAQAGFRMHPGRVLREEYMEPIALDAVRLATALRVPSSEIVAVIDDNTPMTSDLALRLSRIFRATTPQFWLGLQTAYDLAVTKARLGAEIEDLQPLAA